MYTFDDTERGRQTETLYLAQNGPQLRQSLIDSPELQNRFRTSFPAIIWELIVPAYVQRYFWLTRGNRLGSTELPGLSLIHI